MARVENFPFWLKLVLLLLFKMQIVFLKQRKFSKNLHCNILFPKNTREKLRLKKNAISVWRIKQPQYYASSNQRCQPVQIICICPDICAFSVLHNRHCADICTICQKCQFEVRKGWQVLLLQSEAEDKHRKQADSATLKKLFKLCWQSFMVKCIDGVAGIMPIITCPSCNSTNVHFCREKGFVENMHFCHKTGFVANTRLFGFVWCRLLCRHLGFDSDFAQISGLQVGGWQHWLRRRRE